MRRDLRRSRRDPSCYKREHARDVCAESSRGLLMRDGSLLGFPEKREVRTSGESMFIALKGINETRSSPHPCLLLQLYSDVRISPGREAVNTAVGMYHEAQSWMSLV